MNIPRRLATLAATAALTLGGAGGASAATSVESGWWTSAPVGIAPAAAEDQLLVQGGPDQAAPVAYAGISFVLEPGELPQKLVVAVAPGSATTPAAVVALCALEAPASGARGEPASKGPAFDCRTKVEAQPSADGASYEFDVASFGGQGRLDVAVVPTKPGDRVVFTKPVTAALRSGTAGASDIPGTTSSDGSFSEAGTFGATVPSGSAGGFGSPGGTGASFELPAPGAVTAPGALAAGSGSPPPQAMPAATPLAAQPTGSDGTSRSRAPLVFFGLAGVAAAMWALAGRESPQLDTVTGESR